MTFKNAKTILFASLIVAMVLPFSGMNYATAEEQTDEEIYKLAEKAAKLQNRINEGIKVDVNQMKLDSVLDRLNARGISMEGQELSELSEFHSDGLDDTEFEIMCSECDHSIKVKAAYQYFKYTLFGINFYGNVSGGWSLNNMDVTGEHGYALVSISDSHASTGSISGYSVTASDDRPTTATYDVRINTMDENFNDQLGSGVLTTNIQKTYTWSWDTKSSPSTSFYAGEGWYVTVDATLMAIS